MSSNKKISTRLPAGLDLPTRIKPTNTVEEHPVPRVAYQVATNRPIEAPPAPPISSPVQEPEDNFGIKESYLSAKLRRQEASRSGHKSGSRPSTASVHGLNQQQMDQMWREMEDQISYNVLQSKELPQDFLQSIGISGERVMISPKAIAALKQMMEGK